MNCRFIGPIDRQPALPWQPFCTLLQLLGHPYVNAQVW